MDMQELLKQAKNARKSGQQDEAIRLCTEVIEQSSDDQDIAEAYLLRGEVYSMKGNYEDYGHAIQDLSAFIDHIDDAKQLDKLYLAKAHLLRGESERMRDNLNPAIKDCTKVIDEIKPADKFFTAHAHYIRGLIYDVRNDVDLAVKDFTEFIKLIETEQGPEYAQYLEEACLMRGELEIRRGGYKLAIKDSNKVINGIIPKNVLSQQDNLLLVLAYALCGIAYLYSEDENYVRAFDNLSKGYDLDSNNILDKSYFLSFFFRQSEEIEESQRRRLFYYLAPFYKIIRGIMSEAFLQTRETVVHYTNVSTIASLVKEEEKFRLYNTSTMNDPEEGKILFKIMGGSEDYYQKFYEENDGTVPSLEAYIGSFMPEDSRDNLMFWRLYGKDNNREAMGCCLIYTAEVFLESFSSAELSLGEMKIKKMGSSPDASSDILFPHAAIIPETKSEYLFSVFYENTNEVTKLTDKINEIKGYLCKILKMKEEDKYKKHRPFINACVCGLLDNIRFLFKSKHYIGEQELRVIKLRFPHSSDVKTEVTSDIPRLYMEMDEKFRPEEIVLGPRMEDSDAWAALIRHRGISKVSLSKVPFRG